MTAQRGQAGVQRSTAHWDPAAVQRSADPQQASPCTHPVLVQLNDNDPLNAEHAAEVALLEVAVGLDCAGSGGAGAAGSGAGTRRPQAGRRVACTLACTQWPSVAWVMVGGGGQAKRSGTAGSKQPRRHRREEANPGPTHTGRSRHGSASASCPSWVCARPRRAAGGRHTGRPGWECGTALAHNVPRQCTGQQGIQGGRAAATGVPTRSKMSPLLAFFFSLCQGLRLYT